MRIVKRHRLVDEVKKKATLATKYKCGDILDFKYDSKKPKGKVGGWHTDKMPRILVVYDGFKNGYLYGINLNYMPYTFATQLLKLSENAQHIYNRDGRAFYAYLKQKAPIALKSYRAYIRSVAMRAAYEVKHSGRLLV